MVSGIRALSSSVRIIVTFTEGLSNSKDNKNIKRNSNKQEQKRLLLTGLNIVFQTFNFSLNNKRPEKILL